MNVAAHRMSLSPLYSHRMIDFGSLRGLFEHEHSLATYRQHCDRWAVLDLGRIIAAGHGDRRLPITVRCRVCGEVGRLQVRPPVQTRAPGGWMEPPAITKFG